MHQRLQRLDRRTVLKASAGLFATGTGLAAYSQPVELTWEPVAAD